MSPFSILLSLVCTTGISNGGCYRGALLRCQLRTPNQRACFHNSRLELLSVADEQPARRPRSATATQRPRPHPRATRFPSMPLTCNLNLLLPSMHSPPLPYPSVPPRCFLVPSDETRNTQQQCPTKLGLRRPRNSGGQSSPLAVVCPGSSQILSSCSMIPGPVSSHTNAAPSSPGKATRLI